MTGSPADQAARLRRLCSAALAVSFVALMAPLLPWDYSDVSYVLLVERGLWTWAEWAHVLFVPTMTLYQYALRALGYGGPMQVPLQAVNLLASAASLCLLYDTTDRLVGDPILSVASVAVFGFSHCFVDTSLRARACALSVLFLCWTLRLLLVDEPARRARAEGRLGWVASLAVGYNVGAVVVLPAIGAVLWRQLGRRKFLGGASRVFGAFLAGCAGCAVVYSPWHDLPPIAGQLRQISRSYAPLWGNISLAGQAQAYWLHLHCLKAPLQLCALLLALNWPRRRALFARFAAPLTAWAVMVATSLIFFFVGDARNMFLYETCLLCPVVTAIACRENPRLRKAFLWAAPLFIGIGYANDFSSSHAPRSNPVLREVRFLRPLLGPDGLLLLPRCPSSSLIYSRMRLLLAQPADESPTACPVPAEPPGPGLSSRLRDELAQGRAVYAAEELRDLDPEDPLRADLPAGDRSWLERLRAMGFRTEAPVLSPSTTRYVRIR